MSFHRYVQPTYFGAPSIPQGPAPITFNGIPYRFLNVTSGGVGAGDGSAFMDGAKADGPNAGTFVQAFSEQGRAIFANRGLRALAENTDHLDDLFHRDIASPVRTSLTTAGSPVSSIALPASTFIGNAGGYPLDGLFSILDDTNQEILNGTTKVVVQSITGATVGGGFSNGAITLNLNVAIPVTTQYRVYYATRSNLAELPVDALTSISVRVSEEVAAPVRNALAALNTQVTTNTTNIGTNTSNISTLQTQLAAVRQLPNATGLVTVASGVGSALPYSGLTNEYKFLRVNSAVNGVEFASPWSLDIPNNVGGLRQAADGGLYIPASPSANGTYINSYGEFAVKLSDDNGLWNAVNGLAVKRNINKGIGNTALGLEVKLATTPIGLLFDGSGNVDVDNSKVAVLSGGTITSANSRGKVLVLGDQVSAGPANVTLTSETPGNFLNTLMGSLQIGDEINVDGLFSCAHTSGTTTTSYYNCHLEITNPSGVMVQELLFYSTGPMGRVATGFLRHVVTVAGNHRIRASVWKYDSGTANTSFNVLARYNIFRR